MYTEDQLLPISALQHLAFCPRQWGLIHLEQIWSENRLTAEGRNLHERTHELQTESRGDLRIARGLRLHSLRIGLSGQADVVEFHKISRISDVCKYGIVLAGANGLWKPVPVEYKRGKPKKNNCDKVQLCAQALCLEEMLNIRIQSGALYYGKPRRRQEVLFDQSLRQQTELLTRQLHELQNKAETPIAKYSKRCDSCSLSQQCMPKITGLQKKVELYMTKNIACPTGLSEED